MHNFAAHCIATATRILFYIVCFYYLFIVPPISSRIKTTFQHLSFKSVSANRCESSLISRLEECSQVFPWTAPVPGTRTRKLSAVSGGRRAATRASNEPSRRLREDFTITEKAPTSGRFQLGLLHDYETSDGPFSRSSIGPVSSASSDVFMSWHLI